jgi:hypothetical protein
MNEQIKKDQRLLDEYLLLKPTIYSTPIVEELLAAQARVERANIAEIVTCYITDREGYVSFEDLKELEKQILSC